MFPIHNTFPKEMAVIGRLLLGYSELELDLMNCVQVARKYDMNSILKAMFRIRGEMSRIQIADALGRVPYATVGLEGEFSALIDGIDHCRKIRNKPSKTPRIPSAQWVAGRPFETLRILSRGALNSHMRIV